MFVGVAIRQQGTNAGRTIRHGREVLQRFRYSLIHRYAIFQVAVHVVQDSRGRQTSPHEHGLTMNYLRIGMNEWAVRPEFGLAHGFHFTPAIASRKRFVLLILSRPIRSRLYQTDLPSRGRYASGLTGPARWGN